MKDRKKRYRIGLDIGIASIGWAVLRHDENGEPDRILGRGVRVFEPCQKPKDGGSLAAERRASRGIRRSLRRRKHRLERIKHLIVTYFAISESELQKLFEIPSIKSELLIPKNIYEIRYEALEHKLTKDEFARLLVHLAKKRGFKSNRKNAKAGGDDGKLLEATKSNTVKIQSKNYRTIGEYLYKEYVALGRPTRNKGGDYSLTFLRSQTDEEISIIFDTQRKLGNILASERIEKDYKEILLSQRNFDIGPGGNSIWGWGEGSMIERMTGICTFENIKNRKAKDEPRAPKHSYSFERFMLVQKINSLRLKKADYSERALTEEERQKIIDLAYEKSKVTYTQIRKALELGDYLDNGERPELLFNFCKYFKNTKKSKNKDSALEQENVSEILTEVVATKNDSNFYIDSEKSTFVELKGFHSIKKILFDDFTTTPTLLDDIAYVYTFFKNDEAIERELSNKNIPLNIKQKLLASDLNFSKVGNLSIKALQNILPFLQESDENGNLITYDKATELAGYDFRNLNKDGTRKNRLSFNDINEHINSPVVKRAVSQTFKVVNAIVREYGDPEVIFIELAREMAQNFDERNKDEKRMEENRSKNETIKNKLKNEFGMLDPKGLDILKYTLWTQQQNMCAYSGTMISISDLFNDNATQIDHIIPYSMSYDNSRQNTVLVKTAENQNKRNELAYNYIARKDKEQNANGEILKVYEIWVNTYIWSKNKKQKMLAKKVDEEGFKERNLHDTKHATKLVANFLANNLQFAESEKYKRKVFTINGSVTSYVRKRLHFTNIDKSRDTDNHHAQDAVFIAITSPSMVNRISNFEKSNRLQKRKEIVYNNDSKNWIHTPSDLTAEKPGDLFKFQNDESIEFYDKFPPPYPNFQSEVNMWFDINPNNEEYLQQRHTQFETYSEDEHIPPLFISRMSNKKVTGKAHGDIIRRGIITIDDKGKEQKYTVSKVSLDNLKLKKDKEGNDAIENYYNQSSDTLLYNMLLEKLIEVGGDGKKAFGGKTIRKPRKLANGNIDYDTGPIVKSVKIQKSISKWIELPNRGNAYVKNRIAVANNKDRVRIDVFSLEKEEKVKTKKKVEQLSLELGEVNSNKIGDKTCDKKFYFVPIYVADFKKEKLPNISTNGLVMSEDTGFKFEFSLYAKDLIRLQSKGGFKDETKRVDANGLPIKVDKVLSNDKPIFVYYTGADIDSGRISVSTHNRESKGRASILNLLVFEKWEVDLLGNVRKASYQKRDERTLHKSWLHIRKRNKKPKGD